jgi:hypothetical protein
MNAEVSPYHVEDVGRVILQLQNELKNIRQNIGDADTVDEVDIVLERAESDLRAKAEVVLNGMINNSVRTLPTLAKKPVVRRSIPAAPSIPPLTGVRGKLDQARQIELLLDPHNQFSKEYLAARFGLQLNDVNAPPPMKSASMTNGKISKHKTTKPRDVLPKMLRIDPKADRPAVADSELEYGIANLLNRGFITEGEVANTLSHGTALMSNSAAPIHEFKEQHERTSTYMSPIGFNMTTLKLDMQTRRKIPGQIAPANNQTAQLTTQDLGYDGPVAAKRSVTPGVTLPEPTAKELREEKRKAKEGARKNEQKELRQSVDKIRGYNELLDTYSLHQFLIRYGKTLDTTPEFVSFQRKNRENWGAILGVIGALEKLLTKYFVPMAYIDGAVVVKIAADELLVEPTIEELLSCIANCEQVSSLLELPGQRFKGQNSQVTAATCIQSQFRMHCKRGDYQNWQHRSTAASTIQIYFRGHLQRKDAVARLEQHREEQEQVWEELNRNFRSGWEGMKGKRRVAIHIPSMSYEEHCRKGITHLGIRQNMQIAARLCALADPLVDVLYVSPYELTDDVRGYYEKLLEVGGGGGTVQDPSTRFRVIVPENKERFPRHFSLSSLLLYSPVALARVRRFLKGKDAYIVPGSVGPEDKLLALLLHVPLMGPPPDASALYSTKSGAKRLFSAADVNIPVGAHDIYDVDELVATLVKLICTNLDVSRWIIRVDDDTDGRGVALLDVDLLECVGQLRAERLRLGGTDGHYWTRPEVQEAARIRLEEEIRDGQIARKVTLPNKSLYKNWSQFSKAFVRVGGVVEAAPADIRGYPTMSMFIEPSGVVHPVSTHEMMYQHPHTSVGSIFPQYSIPYDALKGASAAIGQILVTKGIFGYVSVNYTAFYDSFHGAMRLWGTDITLGLTNTAASFVMFNFILGGRFDSNSGEYHLQPNDNVLLEDDSIMDDGSGTLVVRDEGEEGGAAAEAQAASTKNVVDKSKGKGTRRHYVVHDYIYHPNLSSLQYSTFFNLCRLQGVSFDLKQKCGTAFMLVDSLAAGVLGMMSVAETRFEALRGMSQTFEFMQEQVGTRSIPSEFHEEVGNFQGCLQVSRAFKKEAVQQREAAAAAIKRRTKKTSKIERSDAIE